MKQLRAWIVRLAGMFTRSRSDREFVREIESHMQLHIDDHVRSGLSYDEARRRALGALGGLERTREEYRDRKGVPVLENLIRDLRHAARGLVKSPGFTVAAIAVLGLGVGVNTAMFSIVNAVVLRPLPFADSDRIVRLWHTPPPLLFTGQQVFSLSPANFIDWKEQSRVFERAAVYRIGRRTISGQGEPYALVTASASADFLPILGLSPRLGRGFTDEDDKEGGPKTVLLSDATWKGHFGADPGVIGRTMIINRVPHTVIGVVPDAPTFINTIQIWVPLAWTAQERAVRNNHNYRAIAKLKPGVDVATAQADLTTIAKRLEQQYPADNKDWGALVLPLQDDLVGTTRSSLLVLLGAVALVLFIACANLANLLLVRTLGRAKEIAVRSALGASRVRVLQQLLAEGMLLGLGGGVAGWIGAVYGVQVLVATFGASIPRAAEIVLDGRVLAFTASVAVLTGLASALYPAWRLMNRDANDALKQGQGRGNSSAGDGRVRRLLVVSEVALALMLLVGAGLLIRSLAGLRSVNPGFDTRNLLTASVGIPGAKYRTPESRVQFFDRALENIRALPGVESAATIDTLPLQGGSSQYVAIEGAPPVPESELPVVAVRMSSPSYFETARIPLKAGRDFTTADALGRPLVAIVSERAAQRFWPNDSPIGKRLTLSLMSPEPREVIGVVGEVVMSTLDEREPETTVYVPSRQFGFGGTDLVVRTTGAPEPLTRSVVSAIQRVDHEQPVLDIATMESVVERSLGERRFAMLLLGGFAALALALAAIGIYSVLAYSVRQRVREIGIRMALGAPTRGVLRLIVVEGLKPTVFGVTIGLALAAALGRVLSTLVYGVGVHDASTYVSVAALVLLVGLVAMLVPVYRATRVDPVVTLRAE
jgi:putative ABC transport system permease protein